MFQLPKKIRHDLIFNFNQVKTYFDDEDYLVELLKKGIPTDHFLILQRLRRLNLDKITDIELIMLCGAFDFVLTPGCYPYASDQTYSLNQLGEAIFALKVCSKKK